MPKRKKSPNRRSRKSPEVRSSIVERLKLKGSFTSVSTLIGFAASVLGLFALWPEVTISRSDTLDRQDVMSTLFQVRNVNLYPIEHVEVACFVGEVRYANNDIVYNSLSHKYWPEAGVLRPDETMSFPCSFGFFSHSPVSVADFGIIVEYHPKYASFFQFEEIRRFRAMWGRNGQFTIVEQPVADLQDRYERTRGRHEKNHD